MVSILTAPDLRMVGIGLADLRGAFGLSSDEGSWLGTAPQVLVAPRVGWMIAVVGVRRASNANLGMGLLAGMVQREANVQAYIDGFWVHFRLRS